MLLSQSPELFIIQLNVIVLLAAYLVFYPLFAGDNLNKLSLYDIVISLIPVTIVGFEYWGSGQSFDLLLFKANWFWFTVITYALIEIPLSILYMYKTGMLDKKKR